MAPKLTTTLVGACLPALITYALVAIAPGSLEAACVYAAAPPTPHAFSFAYSLYPTNDGLIQYKAWAIVPIYQYSTSSGSSGFSSGDTGADTTGGQNGGSGQTETLIGPGQPGSPQDPTLPQILLTEYTLPICTQDSHWHSPEGLFSEREMTYQRALSKGLTQAMLNQAEAISINPVDRALHPIKYMESSIMILGAATNGYQVNSYRAQGSVILNVAIPERANNYWLLKVTDALGAERSGLFTFAKGDHAITITAVEAGNVLVSLKAVNSSGTSEGTYFQEAYALVRKNQPGTINMTFAGQFDADRFRIGLFGVGQNSQRYDDPLPLQKDREAMVRVMVYDAWGDGGKENSNPNQTRKVRITYSCPGRAAVATEFDSHISGYHTRSGKLYGSTAKSNLGPRIPKEYIQPGLTVKAELLQPVTNAVLDSKTISVQVAVPRVITLLGFDVRPPFGSGCTLVRDETQMKDWVLPWLNDVFPYSTIKFEYKKKVWLPRIAGNGVGYLGLIVGAMNTLQGWHETDSNAESEHLYMGMTHNQYGGVSHAGMALPPFRGLAISRLNNVEELGYTIAHEMGHCFNLWHAPSPDADKWPNKIDGNYPYGGQGLAGGWGYTNIEYYPNGRSKPVDHKLHFLSEDAHVNNSGSFIHWDIMSYSAAHYHNRTRFSDYNAEKLKTAVMYSPAPEMGIANIGGLTYHSGSGIPVFGPAAALSSERSLFLLKPEFISSGRVDSFVNINSVPLDFDIPPTLSEDPDGDGTGRPDLIVTRVPRLKGITVEK